MRIRIAVPREAELLGDVAIASQAGVPALAIDADPHAEAFYIACGATRLGATPAPIEGEPQRVRPQLKIASARSNA